MSTTKVFIPNEEFVWVTGSIVTDVDSKGDVTVKIQDEALPNEGAARTISLAKLGLPSLPQQNLEVPPQGVEDMTKLNYLHEPSILDNLKRRFAHKLPYTYTGEVCIAVNPYQWLPLYTDALRESYSKVTRHELSPHVYATSTDAYRGLTTRQKNQSILVTGESGAGKTETVKILMGHLAYIAGKHDDKTVDKLLKANPLMESFGNAKTSRNDNSSRFGKFSQLEFDDLYVLVGSKCITYLLEKSRVINQTKLERNYHIMYQLLAAPEAVKERLLFSGKKSTNFNFLNNGDTKTSSIEGMSDAEHYAKTMSGLEILGVGAKLRALMEQAIAGILHMGQVTFSALKGAADASSISATDESTIACCKMLGVSPEVFAQSVVSRLIEVEGKKLAVPLSVDQAASGRDALAKEIYSRIFNWLVLMINFNTSFAANTAEAEKRRVGECSTISLLDIFGFECFAHNGFEQFCIDFANEKLQQRFTHDVFMTVQKEYQEEGLPWEIIRYKDNQETLDMIEGRLGIIDLLNEECQIPKGTDSNFLTKIKQSFSSHYAFSSDQRSRDTFVIRHYAGPVMYTVNGFMDANKDAVPNNLETMLGQSNNPFLRRLFAETAFFKGDSEVLLAEDKYTVNNMLLLTLDIDEKEALEFEIPKIESSGGGGGGASSGASGRSSLRSSRNNQGGGFVVSVSILTKFKNQLAQLMVMVNSTDVQYVRCIKPNPNKSNTEYNRRMVVEQLRSAGMIEAVRISRAAFPNRLLYRDFMHRFQILRPKKWHESALRNFAGQSTGEQEKNHCKAFLSWAIPDNKKAVVDGTGTTEQYAFGHTKVYFTSFVLETLEAARNKAVYGHVKAIQKIARGFICRNRFGKMVKAVQTLGRFMRLAPFRMQLYRLRKSLRTLQAVCQMRYVRKKFLPPRNTFRQDKDLTKAQIALEKTLNLEDMRARAEAERLRKAAEAEAKRLAIIAEKLRIEEEARLAEEARLRAIEEERLRQEAQIKHWKYLEVKTVEDAALIEELTQKEAVARQGIETEKARSMDLSASLSEAQESIASLKKSEENSKIAIEQERARYRQLDTRLTESMQKVAGLEKAEKLTRQEMDDNKARSDLVAARLAQSQERLIALETTERSLKSQIEEEKQRIDALEAKLKESNERKNDLESSERSLKTEVDDLKDRLEATEGKLRKAEASITSLTQSEALYKETLEAESAKQQTMQLKLNETQNRVTALEAVEKTVKALKLENAELQESVANLEVANETINSMRLKEISLKSQLSAESMKLADALKTIEELESRPAGIAADGSSVLSGLNDMEIVIDEDKGKMKVIITKRRQEGSTLGPVEKFVLN